VRVWLTILWLLVREILRAVLVPWHLLLYLPQRKRWRREAVDMLSQPLTSSDETAAREFGTRSRGHGKIFISAGETSGELHAVKVMRAVRDARCGSATETTWTCFGGPQLEAEGATLLYPLSDRAVMGVTGVLASLPFVLKSVARFMRMLDEDPPDLVVLVDYPGLHLVLARLARKRGIEVLHYIAPQYWAWAPWRMHRYKRSISATLTILPFESTFFGRAGIPSEYVGHPLLDQIEAPQTSPGPSTTLCLLPGSRRKEILRNLPGMIGVAKRLRSARRDATVVLPHTDSRRARIIEDLLRNHDAAFIEFLHGPIGPALSGARVVLAKSGTGSLESCLYRTPTVVVYKLGGAFSTLFTRNFLSVPWIASANLIAGRQVIPEYCFRREEVWDEVTRSVIDLWDESPTREDCLAGLEVVRRRLGQPGASARVARWVLPFCARKT
jgi:lipid-A-disaccharide synthase